MSSEVTVILPDGSERILGPNATGADLAAELGARAAREALVAIVDGDQLDLNRPLPDGSNVSLVFPTSEEGLEILRHSTAHVLAQAVLELYPGATFSIGPPIEDGFYYDFDLPDDQTFSDDDLERISTKMKEIVGNKQPFVRREIQREEADSLFADHPYKLEILDGEADDPTSGPEDGVITTYRNTDAFVDLCRGPHVPDTGYLGPVSYTHLTLPTNREV